MAYTAYDLHRISGGRLVLGLGSQIKAHIVAPLRHAVVAARRADARLRLGDAGDLALLADRRAAELPGRLLHAHADAATVHPGPLDFPSPEIWVAAVGPRMVEAAGDVADGMICHPLISRSYLSEVIAPQVHAEPRQLRPPRRPVHLLAMGDGGHRARRGVAGRRDRGHPAPDRLLRLDAGVQADARAPRLGRPAPRGAPAVEAEPVGRAARLIDDDILNTFAVVGELASAGRLCASGSPGWSSG